MTNKEIGNFGENAAAEFLERNGITVIKRNFYCKWGEIDIICRDGDTIVFVEVKTRVSKGYGAPGEFVNYQKQEKIRKTALYYLGNDDTDMRFDVVEVIYRMEKGTPVAAEINHITSAF